VLFAAHGESGQRDLWYTLRLHALSSPYEHQPHDGDQQRAEQQAAVEALRVATILLSLVVGFFIVIADFQLYVNNTV
jgi:hypothetical protein